MLIKGLPQGSGPPKKNGSVQSNNFNNSSTSAKRSSTNRLPSPENKAQKAQDAAHPLLDEFDSIVRSRRMSTAVEEDIAQGEAYRYNLHPRAEQALAAYQQTINNEQKNQFAHLLGVDIYV